MISNSEEPPVQQPLLLLSTPFDAQELVSSASYHAVTSHDDESHSPCSDDDGHEDDSLSTGSPREASQAEKLPKWNRERNRIHAKNTRERKRQQLEDYHNQIRALLGEKQYLRIVLGDGPDVREDFSRMDIDTIVSLPDFNHMREQLKALRVMDHDLQLLENMDEINTLKRESEISNEELLHLRKERNRIHARKTRIRKKNGMKEAQLIFNYLDKEVKHLRSVALAKLPAVTQAAAAAASAGLVDPRVVGNVPSMPSMSLGSMSAGLAAPKLSMPGAADLYSSFSAGANALMNRSAASGGNIMASLTADSSASAANAASSLPFFSSSYRPAATQYWPGLSNSALDAITNDARSSAQLQDAVQQQQKLMMLGAAASLAPSNPAGTSAVAGRPSQGTSMAEQLSALTQLYTLQSMLLQQALPRVSIPGAQGVLGSLSASMPYYNGANLSGTTDAKTSLSALYGNTNPPSKPLDSDLDSNGSSKRARMDFGANGLSDASYYSTLNAAALSPLLNQWPAGASSLNTNKSGSPSYSGMPNGTSAAATLPQKTDSPTNGASNPYAGMPDMTSMMYGYGLPLQPYGNMMFGANAGMQYRGSVPMPIGVNSNTSASYSLNPMSSTQPIYNTKPSM